MAETVAGLNVVDFQKKKDAKLLTMLKIGSAYAVAIRRFSQEDGTEEEPQVIALSRQQIEEQKIALKKSTDGLDAILVEMDALE